jgi:hypothetical protein
MKPLRNAAKLCLDGVIFDPVLIEQVPPVRRSEHRKIRLNALRSDQVDDQVVLQRFPARSALPSLPKSPFPRPSPQGTLEALPYPTLRRLSRPRYALLRAAPAGLPRRAACAARAVGKAWPPAGGAGEGAAGAGAKCRLFFLSVYFPCPPPRQYAVCLRTETSSAPPAVSAQISPLGASYLGNMDASATTVHEQSTREIFGSKTRHIM